MELHSNPDSLNNSSDAIDAFSSNDSLGPDFLALYRSQVRTDVTLILQSREFKVHRLILSTRSQYFAELFSANPNQSEFVLEHNNFNLDAFETTLEYIYSGLIVLSTKKEEIFEPIANKLRLHQLQKLLGTFCGTELTEYNVLRKLIGYHETGNRRGVQQCLLFLDHVFVQVLLPAEDTLLELPFDLFSQIVQRKTLDATETQVCKLLMKWHKRQAEKNSTNSTELQQQMKQMTQHLNLYLLAHEHIELLVEIKTNGWADVELLWEAVDVGIQQQSGRRDLDTLFKRRTPGPKIPKKQKQALKVAILGLERSGKTYICESFTKLHTEVKPGSSPSLLNLITMEYGAYTIKFRDYAGSKDGQKLWFSEVNKDIDGLIWVIDSTNFQEENIDRINDFMDFVGKPTLPVLLFANKQGAPAVATVTEIIESLRITNRMYFSQTKRTILGTWRMEEANTAGLHNGMKWLVEEMIAFILEKKKTGKRRNY